MSPNLKAFLDMIAASEIGPGLLAVSDNGYNVLVGSVPSKPLLFNSYADHPRILNKAMNSTAAGRYQILRRYYDAYKQLLGLPDFSPASQDKIAIRMIKEQGALADIEAGRIKTAIAKCSNIWASFPGAKYNQPVNPLPKLLKAYTDAGGTLA